jgi:replicative DNA helicase
MSNREEPHNAEAEAWLLGGVFQDPKSMASVSGLLDPADFYHEKNRIAWAAMQNLQKENKPIDIISVGSECRRTGAGESLLKDNDYLFALSECAVSAANIEHYAELIRDASSKRLLLAACGAAMGKAMDPSKTASECIEAAITEISGISQRANRAEIEHISDTVANLLEKIKRLKKEGRAIGMHSCFPNIDALTGGFRKSEMTIIGARTGVGKTSFALGIALHIAKSHGAVLMFSLEMSREQIAGRTVACNSGVNLKKLMTAHIDMEEMQSCQNVSQVVQSVPFYGCYEKNMSVEQISSLACSVAAKTKLEMIIIDHLQIVNTNSERKNYENRNIAIGQITRALKILGGKLDCHVIALSQLNREEKTAHGKPQLPRLGDLRDSGNIEQDADAVLLMHRLTKEAEGRDTKRTDLIVAKNRSGPTGETTIHFNPQNAMFSEYNQ